MSTKKVVSGFAPGGIPTLMDATPPKTTGYFTGQLITLTPEIDANGVYDKATYGTELDVTPHLQESPGLQVLPSPAKYNVPIPDPFPSSGKWQCPVPAVVQGLHGTTPAQWNAKTTGGTKSLSFSTPPALGGVTQPAGGLGVVVPAKFLTGVSTLTAPPTANQVRIQVSAQKLNPDLSAKGAVPAGSGPFMGFFHVTKSSHSLTSANLAIYNKTGSGAPTPVTYSDGKQIWAQSDADGNFDLYIVPAAGTDQLDGWIELTYTTGLVTCATSLIIIPPKLGFELDDDLDAPYILEESEGIVDPSSTSTYNVVLPDDALSGIAAGTDMFLLINGKQQTSTLTSKKNWMNGTTPVFTIDASNPDVKTIDAGVNCDPTNENRLQYVVLDPALGLLGSGAYVFWARKSTDQLAPPGPPNPDGDPSMSAPTIRQLRGMTLSGSDIVTAGGVNVDVSWQPGAWTQANGQSIKVQIWLNGYHDGGLKVHQDTLTASTPVGAATTSPQTVFFDMEQFADYGPPHSDVNQLPTMEVQYYVIDADGVSILRTSPAVTIYLDTIPAGD